MASPRALADGVVLLGRHSLSWEATCYKRDKTHSADLLLAVDTNMFDGLLSLEFPVTVADPTLPGCPLVACSLGFRNLTGYKLDEITGKNSDFLDLGVPDKFINKETRRRVHAFCLAAAEGYDEQEPGTVPEALRTDHPSLRMGFGEDLYVQTSATKNGELFSSMLFLKTVELDDRPFVIGLQTCLGKDHVGCGADSKSFREVCAEAFVNLSKNMDTIEAMLASRFNYSSAMRRSHESGTLARLS